MKFSKNGLCCFLLSLSFYAGFSQPPVRLAEPDYNKPKLFSSLPETIPVNPQSLDSLLFLSNGAAVAIPLQNFFYRGVIVSKSDASEKTFQSAVVRSTSFKGSSLTFSKITNDDGTIVYRGRIFSRDHSDMYELLLKDGAYVLQKNHQLKLMNE